MQNTIHMDIDGVLQGLNEGVHECKVKENGASQNAFEYKILRIPHKIPQNIVVL